MTNDQMLEEIREANLSYLLLAQNLVRHDRAAAIYRLGLTEEAADVIGRLTVAQCVKIASRNVLICRFRFDDDMMWSLLTDHGRDGAAKDIHASILLASRALEGVA